MSNNIPKIINKDKLIKHSKKYRNIYSGEGMYKIRFDKIVKLIPEDIEPEFFSLNKIDFSVDKSIFLEKDVNWIPNNHQIVDIEEIEYKLYNNSSISLIEHYNKGEICNIFFITKLNIIDTNIKNDIMSYLTFIET